MENHEARSTHKEIFEMMTANECLAAAADGQPLMLFGDLWLTGELSVMFAGAGSGKSLLAVQITESIASGRSIEPFEMTAPAQKVLYIDLEQGASQFRGRYTSELGEAPGKKRVSKPKRHCFSDNFIRPFITDVTTIKASDLAPIIETSGTKVLIIDSIAHLQRYSIPRETANVMRELRRLKNRYGLSILVLTHTARSAARRGLEATDMACGSVMVNLADNIFAIGQRRSDSSARYIKHIKPGAAALSFGSAHLPWFKIVKRDDTFPAFEFQDYGSEALLIAGDGDSYEWRVIRQIKQKSVAGATIREIADVLNMSKSTVQRYLKMAPEEWGNEPERKAAEPVFYTFEKCIYERCRGCGHCGGRSGHNKFGTPGNIYGHGICPDDCDICGPRRYNLDDPVDPDLKELSETFYENLRQWLIDGKRGERPKYPGQRRYGIAAAGWFPNSENWTDEQLSRFKTLQSQHNFDDDAFVP